MTAVRVGTAIALALALQTTLARFLVGSGSPVDLVLVAVVYTALTDGPVAGLLGGAAGGIIQDALSGGIIGVGGLAKTIVGSVVGVLGTQFIVVRPLPRFLAFVGASLMHALAFLGLYAMLESPIPTATIGAVVTQAIGNGVAGILAFGVIQLAPRVVGRRREQASVRRRVGEW